MRSFCSLLCFFLISSAFAKINSFEMTLDDYLKSDAIVVPRGNSSNQNEDYDTSKYKNVIRIITKKQNICVIHTAAEIYNVDPVMIIGSIVGEHTFNVDIWDIAQENYMYMWHKWISRFDSNGIDLAELIKEDKYNLCPKTTDNNYDLWGCYNLVWKTDRRNTRKGSKNWEIKWTFFNPLGSGYTYGFGQLGPERALMVADFVSKVSGFDELTIADPPAIYEAILNPQVSIHYVAATNRVAIDLYKKYANFDISQNPGVVATLYNLGREYERAEKLYNKTLKDLSKNGKATYPDVNYYGWFINSKEMELRKAYEIAVEKHHCKN
jgi:hypothetical protein